MANLKALRYELHSKHYNPSVGEEASCVNNIFGTNGHVHLLNYAPD